MVWWEKAAAIIVQFVESVRIVMAGSKELWKVDGSDTLMPNKSKGIFGWLEVF